MTPCGYENDGENCEKPWQVFFSFSSKPANCSAHSIYKMNTPNIGRYTVAIEDVRATPEKNNVKRAEFHDFL